MQDESLAPKLTFPPSDHRLPSRVKYACVLPRTTAVTLHVSPSSLFSIFARFFFFPADLSENEEDYEYSYDDDENYTYLNEEDLFESQGSNGRQPQFETEAQHFRVELGHTIRLPCRVDSLGVIA